MPKIPFEPALRDRIAHHLDDFARDRKVAEGLKRAAVALTVVEDEEGNGAFLLTRRASKLRAHAGQWALPGGRVDPGEGLVAAALRELDEELGLQLQQDSVLGVLDDYPTRSGYLITPVIVWGGTGLELRPNPHEVASVHHVPLGELHRADSPEFITIPESDRPVIRLYIMDSQIHAPTAAVLFQFREVALHGRHTRVDHYEQPVWAWR